VFLCTCAHTYSNDITIAPFVFVPACINSQTDNMAGAFEALLEREPTYTWTRARAYIFIYVCVCASACVRATRTKTIFERCALQKSTHTHTKVIYGLCRYRARERERASNCSLFVLLLCIEKTKSRCVWGYYICMYIVCIYIISRIQSIYFVLHHKGGYLVDPASSHMLVSKIKPCMSKYKLVYTARLRMAH
jgi:hypothetical protein